MRRLSVLLVGVALLIVSLACMPSTRLALGETPRATLQRATTVARPTTVVPTVAPLPTIPPLSGDTLAYVMARDQALAAIYSNYGGSVVHIYITNVLGETGTGSGWVWDQNGYIVTNNHVVEDASEVTVVFSDESQYEATVVGTDKDSDLAVVQVSAEPSLLVPLQLGDSDQVQVGQTTVAIGNPFGFEGTMTSGIVSAMGRITVQESGYSLPNLIQTDAAINPGNSGGPLFDIAGRVIGVNTMIYSTTGEFSGIGFAVPVNMVKRVVPALINEGFYQHPYLGVRGWTITDALAEAAALPVDRGALIGEVTAGGPADEAGLRGGSRRIAVPGYATEGVTIGGDIIVAIDGHPVEGMNDLITRLEAYSVGDEVVLTIVRDGETMDVTVTLGARPTESGRVFGSD